ncbi:uncharacterized protein KY384_001567 [Bacidia gigantensis]|uniref:uncharacterized protein n=1 Tax=Bacidia gigantensis TaxID=2732470 RepID=UPI001D04C937|nr:uncharacterized protein KY384_001567 [Bacidia gigantensis]KAG8533826.1 hypothetical protein KY384_001567 [Bacidia gigantensis]
MSEKQYQPIPGDLPPSYDAASADTKKSPPKAPLLRAPLPLNLPLISSLKDKRVILASASPRRKQLLAQIGFSKIEILPSTLPENLPKSLSPFEYVLATARQKALNVYTAALSSERELGAPALVIAADTVVVSNGGQVLEKPRSEGDHIAMLKRLRNSVYHKVYTGVVAVAPLASCRDPGYSLETTVEETTVRLGRDIGDDMLMAYVRTREGADKAGGYGIQGIGAILVDRIEGSYDNVVGLPLRATLGLVEKVLRAAEEDDLEDEFVADGEDG